MFLYQKSFSRSFCVQANQIWETRDPTPSSLVCVPKPTNFCSRIHPPTHPPTNTSNFICGQGKSWFAFPPHTLHIFIPPPTHEKNSSPSKIEFKTAYGWRGGSVGCGWWEGEGEGEGVWMIYKPTLEYIHFPSTKNYTPPSPPYS